MVQDDAYRTVGTQVDVLGVDKTADERPFYGEARDQSFPRLERKRPSEQRRHPVRLRPRSVDHSIDREVLAALEAKRRHAPTLGLDILDGVAEPRLGAALAGELDEGFRESRGIYPGLMWEERHGDVRTREGHLWLQNFVDPRGFPPLGGIAPGV
jgi:hypothetical protein